MRRNKGVRLRLYSPFAFCHFTSALMVCPHCDGTGWKPVEDNGSPGLCAATAGAIRSATSASPTRTFRPRYQHCTFANFLTYPNESAQAVAAARRFADTFLSSTRDCCSRAARRRQDAPGRLRAEAGRSRTTGVAACSTTREVCCRSHPQHLRSVIQDDRDRHPSAGHEAELLVLDDLGAERPTEWVEETMNLIVNTRYNARRRRFSLRTTRTFPIETEDMNSLLLRMGFRLHSRLQEMCEFMEYGRRRLPRAAAQRLAPRTSTSSGRANRAASCRPAPRGPRAPSCGSQRRDGKADLKWPGGRAGS